jgi:uncharacterized protein (UPF0335 family)
VVPPQRIHPTRYDDFIDRIERLTDEATVAVLEAIKAVTAHKRGAASYSI